MLARVIWGSRVSLGNRDDGGIFPCTLCPVVRAVTPPGRGWCTLTLSPFNGEGPLGSLDFTVIHGRYLPTTNPNCSPASPVSIFEPLGAEKDGDGGSAGPGGGTSR